MAWKRKNGSVHTTSAGVSGLSAGIPGEKAVGAVIAAATVKSNVLGSPDRGAISVATGKGMSVYARDFIARKGSIDYQNEAIRFAN
jgi:hypothetical protein